MTLSREHRLKRLRFRAWHRGTKEADLLIGGFFDRHSVSWDDHDVDLFERLLEEQDVDIMAWAIGSAATPGHYDGALMQAMQRLDYIAVER